MNTMNQTQVAQVATISPSQPPRGPMMALTNKVVRFLLRSPLHGWLSDSLLLLTFTGRSSGVRYTLPVSYWRIGDTVLVFTYRSRTWWKNLRGGAPVVLDLKRQRLQGIAETITDDRDVITACLNGLLRAHPRRAQGYHVPLNAYGQPDPEAVRQAAQDVVLVRIQLATTEQATEP